MAPNANIRTMYRSTSGPICPPLCRHQQAMPELAVDALLLLMRISNFGWNLANNAGLRGRSR